MDPLEGVAQGIGLAPKLIPEVSAGLENTVHHGLSRVKSLDMFR